MAVKLSLAVAAIAALMSSSALAQVEIKLGHVGEPGSLFALSAEEFARLANEKLGDKGEVVVFGSSQLGTDEELMQKLRLGTADLALPSSVMSSIVPEFGLFEMPYLVKDREHMKKIEEEVVWPTLAPAAEAQGYKLLAVWENGFRHITNNVRPVTTPEDLSGVKLRTPSGEWRVKMFQAYGANPTPMSFSEVFTALQTGVMDGQENPLTQIYTGKFQEVQDYLSMTGHVYTPAYLLAGRSFDGYPEDVQQILDETAKETQAFVYENALRLEDELLATMQEESDIEVNEADKDAFIEASASIYEEFGEQIEGGKEMIDTAISLGSGS
ncbi:TRAP transporter substrate-binding protein [Pararhizobium haloflavum]|uniref:TRAP transporter substrate-binding protein n=1 Tax=Pararhizobium haloflavum TaxID=2037914 RepID=UPI000C18D91E|nr:TRAP transporter substrate-binding protein [Pararhizobium haloflavum]